MLASLACWKASLEIKQVYWSCGRTKGLNQVMFLGQPHYFTLVVMELFDFDYVEVS
jgi:hypothetical protein